MVSTKHIFGLLSAILVASASPAKDLAARQAYEIPPNSLYLVEWYPAGCGNGNGKTLSGDEDRLASCVNLGGLVGDGDKAAVRFLFPEDDDRVFKWKLFKSSDCSEQIAEGDTGGCFSVPKGEVAGAVIVYT